MATLKIDGLFILYPTQAGEKPYPRIFVSLEEAEKTGEICYGSDYKIEPAFINED